jgi:mRNA interferase RelE/StbE
MVKEILLSTPAQKQYKNLNIKIRNQIKRALKKLSQKDKKCKLDIKKLRGIKNREDLYRLRVGKYRIIYFEEKKSIKITKIIPRSKGYDWL